MGELIGNRYETLEPLGSGNESTVVHALDHRHDRHVVLKIRPAPRGAHRDDLLREARVLLSLEPHPGLPLVREDFFDGDRYIVVMDWVEGIDLGRLLRERGSPGVAPSTVLRHLAQVAGALTHLHAHDPPVVHGDVKPANIVLTPAGRVVLVDFGVASSADRSERIGTQGFTAPEVAETGVRTPASDVYSLAMTAFTLVTGHDHQGGPAVWPPSVDPARARVFERAIALGTATDPSRRPSSAGEFLEYLRAGWEADLPAGVVTFCMSDIEGSSRLWEAHARTMAAALVRHEAIIAQAVESHRGTVVRSMGEGDSSVSVFTSAIDAVPAAAAIVEMTEQEEWPDGFDLRVRVGLHTGTAERREGDYYGAAINRAGRVRALADGGQVFLSHVTADLVMDHLADGYKLVDLGPHTLRGMNVRERIYALSTPSVAAPPSPSESPYRGLLAFEPDDGALYFGRETVIADLASRAAAGRHVAVVGASGSGKSSLVRAGLIPAVRRGEVVGLRTAALLLPGADPLQAWSDLVSERPPSPDQLLVVDQSEELFTLCTDPSARARFVEHLLSHPGAVVLCLRADFYGHLTQFADLAATVSANHVLLGPMRREELRRAIEEPAKLAGLRLEHGLVELILRDSVDEPGALPLMSHALMETWARRDGRELTVQGYHEAGGVADAIARTADDVFEACSATERELLRRIFVRLTELGDGTEDTRRRVLLSEFLSEEASPTAALLETLTSARLLVVEGDTAEVAHEALIRRWPRLRGWLNDDREQLRLHRHLTRAAHAWEAIDRDPGELYRGARLGAAVDWASAAGSEMTTTERRFLDASRAEQDREIQASHRRNRRLRALLAGVAAALVVAIVAGSLAFAAQGRASRAAVVAQSGRLASQSREAAVKHPDLGLLLALEAGRIRSSIETRSALLGALERGGRMSGQLQGLTAPPSQVSFSPDGKTLATTGLDGTTIWDVATRRAAGHPLRSAQGGWQGSAFSPDGRTLAIGGQHGIVELWDVATRTERGRLS
ncbi:MAG: protein kinase, partial [Actinomycetota bacterium]